jgi:hypothetical protein
MEWLTLWNGCINLKLRMTLPPDVFCTKLIPVPNYVPTLLERPYVWLQMKELPVRVLNLPK